MSNKPTHSRGIGRDISTPAMLALACLLVILASCATTSQGPPGTRANPYGKNVELIELRGAIARGVSDPARRQSLLVAVEETESQISDMNKLTEKAGGKVSGLMGNHKKSKTDVMSQMNKWAAEERPMSESLTRLVFKMKSDMTHEEWNLIHEVMIKSVYTRLDHFTLQRGA